jgi:hypothetical protein
MMNGVLSMWKTLPTMDGSDQIVESIANALRINATILMSILRALD